MTSFSLALLLLAPAAAGAVDFSGNLQVTGQVGVGTEVPRARLHVEMKAADSYALLVSSPNGTQELLLDKQGRLGVGVSTPGSKADVQGSADDGDIGLLLRVGNSSQTTDSSQILFSYSTTSYRHNLRTQHDATQYQYNSIEFFLWNATAPPSSLAAADLGDLGVLALEGMTALSSGSVHVMPFGTPDAELEVSSRTTLGGGTIHRAAAVAPSSKRLKSDIEQLGIKAQDEAAAALQSMRFARFRYKGAESDSPLLRGLIYEETPASIQGPGKTVVLDERILNLELALQAVHRRIAEAKARLAELEGGSER